MSVISIDFDGTVVEQGDYESPFLKLRPGAREALWRLRAADHVLLLFSARANRALLYGEQWDPMVRAGHRSLDGMAADPSRALNWRRYREMVDFCATELPGVFHAVDDGQQGKPVCDIFIDDRAWGSSVKWAEIELALGADWMPRRDPVDLLEDAHYVDVLASMWNLPLSPAAPWWPIGWTSVGPVIRVRLRPRTGTPRGRLALIAGQHGEEQAGVAAICNHWRALQQLVDAWMVEAWIYPCVNPEGFDIGKRWNWRQQKPTNAAIEYEVAPGDWRGELDPGQEPRAVRPCARASDESRWLINDLERCRPDVVLDLHQDSMVGEGGAFAYVFGRREPYAEAMRRSGATPMADRLLRNESWTEAAPELRTDHVGLTTFHDGSITAWQWLRGARLAACVETGFKNFKRAADIHWQWVRWAIEAAGTGARARGRLGDVVSSGWDGSPIAHEAGEPPPGGSP